MTLTTGDIQALKAATKEMAAMYVPSTVTLVDSRAQITVSVHVGLRSTGVVLGSSRSSGLTGGADQDRYVCIIDYDSWQAASPSRPPKRGDVIDYGDQGMKYGIERVVLAQPGGVPILYKAELNG